MKALGTGSKGREINKAGIPNKWHSFSIKWLKTGRILSSELLSGQSNDGIQINCW